jgi:oligopeptide transport system permease protein
VSSTAPIKDQVENEFNQPVKGSSLTQDAWKRLKKNTMAMTGLVIVLVYTLLAITAPILPIYSYDYGIVEHQHLPPSFTKAAGELMVERQTNLLTALAEKDGRELNDVEKARLAEMEASIETETRMINGKEVFIHNRRYLLGTDYRGRDMLSRIIYGGQISIAVGLIGSLFSVIIGIIVGSLAGYIGGTLDYILMRIVDIMYSLPFMLIIIIFMSIFPDSSPEQKLLNIFIALSLISWLTVSRVVRGQIISLKNSEFVEAARSMGAPTVRIIAKHLVPNTLGVIIVYSSLRVPSFIMSEAFLSFLGLGISAPFASWGTLVSDAVSGMQSYPWALIFPGLAMAIFLFGMNFLGDGLRDAFDPQSKNRL